MNRPLVKFKTDIKKFRRIFAGNKFQNIFVISIIDISIILMFLFNFRMENIESVVFYTIDKSIKAYRQYAQKQLKESGFHVTIDQWLVLKNIQELPQISQQELSRRVFKDTASVTRIIDLLVKQGMITREASENDRRRNFLKVTQIGRASCRERV